MSSPAAVDLAQAGGIVLTREAVEQVYAREADLQAQNAGACSSRLYPLFPAEHAHIGMMCGSPASEALCVERGGA